VVQILVELLPVDLGAVLVVAVVLSLQKSGFKYQHACGEDVFPEGVSYWLRYVLVVDHLALLGREIDISETAVVIDEFGVGMPGQTDWVHNSEFQRLLDEDSLGGETLVVDSLAFEGEQGLAGVLDQGADFFGGVGTFGEDAFVALLGEGLPGEFPERKYAEVLRAETLLLAGLEPCVERWLRTKLVRKGLRKCSLAWRRTTFSCCSGWRL
jgi:hypothetical protein